MNLSVRKKLKWVAIGIVLIIVIAASYGLYLFYKPHRDVSAAAIFEEISVSDLIRQFSNDPSKANAKYLSEDGNSKVLLVTGKIKSVNKNLKNEYVVVLKDDGSDEGINCTFGIQNQESIAEIKKGDIVKIKGAITSGNYYDSTLDMHSNATLVQCSIVK